MIDAISRRTLACQYGSRDELAIMLARQSKPIETSSPDARQQAVVTRDAAVGGLELRRAAFGRAHRRGRRERRAQSAAATTAARGSDAPTSFPSLQEAAVEPVPQEIEDHLLRSSGGVGDRDLQADVDADVLPAVERDLELRHDIDVGRRAILESRSVISSSIGDHMRPSPCSCRKLCPSADRQNSARGLRRSTSAARCRPGPEGTMRAGRIWPYAANASNVVTPLPRPLSLLPVGMTISPCAADDRVRVLANSTCFSRGRRRRRRARRVPLSSCTLLNGIASSS